MLKWQVETSLHDFLKAWTFQFLHGRHQLGHLFLTTDDQRYSKHSTKKMKLLHINLSWSKTLRWHHHQVLSKNHHFQTSITPNSHPNNPRGLTAIHWCFSEPLHKKTLSLSKPRSDGHAHGDLESGEQVDGGGFCRYFLVEKQKIEVTNNKSILLHWG